MLIRRFNPVGQGAFYTEQFDEATVVFDCGTSTQIHDRSTKSIPLIEREIMNIFEKGQEIDAVFISHLHIDHINGLEFLLKHCKVRRVFLPLLSESEKAICLIEASLSGSENQTRFVRNFILSPNTIREYYPTEIVMVEAETLDNPRDEGVALDQLSSASINSGKKIWIPNSFDWIYVPYNFLNRKRSAVFQEALELRGIRVEKDGMFRCVSGNKQISMFSESSDHLNKEEILSFNAVWGDESLRSKLIQSYRDIEGDLNENSMAVYSGPANGYCCQRQGEERPGCLYLGDYNAKGKENWLKLYDAYSRYRWSIGICQIPHHGSSHNYNEKLVTDFGASELIISAGYDNQYRHPHASVVNNIIRNRKNLHIVSEQVGSTVVFAYQDI